MARTSRTSCSVLAVSGPCTGATWSTEISRPAGWAGATAETSGRRVIRLASVRTSGEDAGAPMTTSSGLCGGAGIGVEHILDLVGAGARGQHPSVGRDEPNVREWDAERDERRGARDRDLRRAPGDDLREAIPGAATRGPRVALNGLPQPTR